MPINEDIVARAKANEHFREVVSTGPNSQVVVMCLRPGEAIGEEIHDDVDQVLVFVEGRGTAVLDGARSVVTPGRLVHVPAGTRHDFINDGQGELRLYTIYAPPEHPEGTVHATKAEAEAAEHH